MATQITALPIPPSRQDPANFAARADAFLGALPTFRTQANQLAVEAEQDAATASTAATNASASASSALASKNAAEAAFDSFDDRYLGAKNADPTVDNDGQPLLTGALYFNTVVPEMRVYTGTAWVTASTVGGTVTNLTVTGTFVPPNDSIALGTKTTGSYVQRASVTGNGLSGSVNAEAANFVVNSNATATNTASTLVFRDASGNFAAGTITGNLTGTASLASNANQLNGFSSDTNASANTVARRDASGFLYGVYLNQGSGNDENPAVSQVMVTNGNDGFLRKASLAHLGNQLNTAQFKTYYLRSETFPTMTKDTWVNSGFQIPDDDNMYFAQLVWLNGNSFYNGNTGVFGGLSGMSATGSTHATYSERGDRGMLNGCGAFGEFVYWRIGSSGNGGLRAHLQLYWTGSAAPSPQTARFRVYQFRG